MPYVATMSIELSELLWHAAQGMTRNTLIAGEGSINRSMNTDAFSIALPTPQAMHTFFRCFAIYSFKTSTRTMMGNQNRSDFSLALPDVTAGGEVSHRRGSTAFGPVSLRVQSHLEEGFVVVEGTLPNRQKAEKTELKLRLPEPWKMHHAVLE
ncbi:MAG: hypothetical protein U0905_18365 [Pirellulales bacterium]